MNIIELIEFTIRAVLFVHACVPSSRYNPYPLGLWIIFFPQYCVYIKDDVEVKVGSLPPNEKVFVHCPGRASIFGQGSFLQLTILRTCGKLPISMPMLMPTHFLMQSRHSMMHSDFTWKLHILPLSKLIQCKASCSPSAFSLHLKPQFSPQPPLMLCYVECSLLLGLNFYIEIKFWGPIIPISYKTE